MVFPEPSLFVELAAAFTASTQGDDDELQNRNRNSDFDVGAIRKRRQSCSGSRKWSPAITSFALLLTRNEKEASPAAETLCSAGNTIAHTQSSA